MWLRFRPRTHRVEKPQKKTPHRKLIAKRTARRLRIETLDDRRLLAFAPAVDYLAGNNPVAAVTGDFNSDGLIDVATANHGDNSVHVRLGNGMGGLEAATQFGTGPYPHALATGDFNNDGKLDLASANFEGISVLLGTGTGTFQPAIDTDLWPNMPLSMAVGDFNEDGKMDVALGTAYFYDAEYPNQGQIGVLLGNGAGSFMSANWHSITSSFPVGLAAADLNGDGHLDVVTADEDYSTSTIMLGVGDGILRFAPIDQVGAAGSPQSVVLADFNNDGIADLLTAGQTVNVSQGIGDGAFEIPISYDVTASGRAALAVTDFNDDGNLDVVTANSEEGTISVLLGRGTGTFAAPIIQSVSGLTAVAVGDFNGDSKPDLITTDSRSNRVSVLINDGVWPNLDVRGVKISDVVITEPTTAASNTTFTVTLSAASDQPITVQYTTVNGTARESMDYQTSQGSVTFASGQTQKTIAVLVYPDNVDEFDQYFYVRLSSTDVEILDVQARGTIIDTDAAPTIAINNSALPEGNTGFKSLVFTVTLSEPSEKMIWVSYSTADGSARYADSDYANTTGGFFFLIGETSRTIPVTIRCDTRKEKDETFFMNLYGGTNAVFADRQGIGTILNDDGLPRRK